LDLICRRMGVFYDFEASRQCAPGSESEDKAESRPRRWIIVRYTPAKLPFPQALFFLLGTTVPKRPSLSPRSFPILFSRPRPIDWTPLLPEVGLQND
jgi:hypothetical protein